MADTDDNKTENSCWGPASSCCGGSSDPTPDGITRRQFLTRTGAASAALLFAGLPRWGAGSGEVRLSPHLIPKDKDLPAGWLKSLTPKGEPELWTKLDLATVGMPVGGIGAGQLYLCGDGTLGLWEIFNEHEHPPHGAQSYARRTIPKPVRHGLAIYWQDENKTGARMLDESGFTDVSFRNTHPIGTVSYSDPDCPLKATLEGFSPFIPLNAKDSGLPATMMLVTVENTADHPVEVGTASWLENPIGRKAADEGINAERKNSIVGADGSGRILHSAAAVDEVVGNPREPIVFQDFEGTDFGDWKVAGTAFGDAPTTGNLPTQEGVADWEGAGFAGSFRERDSTTGSLTSPPFSISRRFINFKVGGGKAVKDVGMRLFVGGKIVRQSAGKNAEPLEWKSWHVEDLEGQEGYLEIIDKRTDGWGHIQIDHIEFADERKVGPAQFEEASDAGTMAWGVSEPLLSPDEAARILALPGIEAADVSAIPQTLGYGLDISMTSGIVTRPAVLQPGEKKTFTHVLTWHFPNTIAPDREAGHYYAALYPDAEAVLNYVLENRDRLVNDTRKWRDTYYDSTLPVWLLDRIHMTSCCLATGTTMWWKSGRFWAWEGVVCCAGTCTHVYNYVQTVARLFPELERNLREQQDLKPGVGLEPTGLVGFRHDGKYAADGQCGTVLKVYREHQMSADDSFLRRNWAATKLVLDYAIAQDGNADGIMEGSQHNTYDVNFWGPNTFVGALYLAALRAGEEMAREMGEADYADRLHQIFEKGRAYTEEKLWNGEFFIQNVDLTEHEQHQYGNGCLSDQVFGQNWAHQLNLGYVYDPAKVRKALASVWHYNWAPDLGPYNEVFPAQRVFAEAAEAGLFNCTWPNSEHLDNGVLYRDEVWSGVEYQVGSHMIYEGLMTEGLAMCRAVHDRYSPGRRNPYNEIECSDYYSRAMASWGVLLALSGFQYHGPKGHMAFNPRITPDNFRCAFNAAEGWGTFEQKEAGAGHQWTLAVKHGQVKLNVLEVQGVRAACRLDTVTLGGAPVANVSCEGNNGKLYLQFTGGIVIKQGEELVVVTN